jgi:hypothetical protein
VCGAFIQIFGSLVSEGVTNQSRERGINYANSHLAMGQMTRILLKTTSPGALGVTAASPGVPEALDEGRSSSGSRTSTHSSHARAAKCSISTSSSSRLTHHLLLPTASVTSPGGGGRIFFFFKNPRFGGGGVARKDEKVRVSVLLLEHLLLLCGGKPHTHGSRGTAGR